MQSTEQLKNQVIKENSEKYTQVFRKLSFSEIEILNTELILLLKVFDEICRKNGLTYMLVAGGLIGALRDGKCIPWDDDIDLVMPRKDYETFGKILHQLDDYSDYEMKYPENSSIITMAAHFYNKNNKITNKIDSSIDESKIYEAYIYLDILPMDYCPENKLVDMIRGNLINCIQLGFVSRRCFKKNDPFINYLAKDSKKLRLNLLLRKVFSIPFIIIPRKCIFNILRILAYKKESSFITIPYGALRYFGEKTSASIWFPVKDIDFCGYKIMAPNNPVLYLENRYGDYITVPSKSEQEERMIRLKKEWKDYV